ncbi:MAG: 50S ribosomal protein L32e, partial [Promethearchaeota archaeon]
MSNSEKLRLLRIREMKKKQRPSFVRNESWRYKKLAKSGWRKQRGIDNKTRRKTKNGVRSPEPGFRGPRSVRNLHPSGLEDVLIMHISELDKLDTKIHGVRIAKRLGARKRLALVEEARDRGFNVLNIGLSKEDLLELEEEI